MISLYALVEKLSDPVPSSVTEAGDQLLHSLSGSQVSRAEFVNDPLLLIGPPYFASRYLAQVTLRALKNEYETVDEVLGSLAALGERNPPILEPKKEIAGDRIVLPEAKVLDLRYPEKGEDGIWHSSIDVLVTSGPLRDREVHISIRSDQNRTACFLVPYLWVHSTIAAYNLAASVGGPAGNDEAAKRCTEEIRPVGPTLSKSVGGPAGNDEAAKRCTEEIRPVGPTLNKSVGGPAGNDEAAKRCSEEIRPVGPTLSNFLAAVPETFIVLEPMRQVNATSVARSLHCTKPQIDQIRRGKGDVTIHTLKGQLVHALFDRMLEGGLVTDDQLEGAYREVFPTFTIPLASVTDEFFDEEAFRADVLRHTDALKQFIDRNPHLLEHTQLELKRYSATIGIQGRIDAIFREGNRIDILELKTGARLRPEDHAQLFIYRLLLSDLIRRWQRDNQQDVQITTRLLSSIDGSFAPLRVTTDFYQVLDARNKLVAIQYGLGRDPSHIVSRYEGFNQQVCDSCPSWTRRRCKDASDIFGDRPAPGAAVRDAAELEYFRRFTRLVQRERWYADQEVADLLDDSRLEFRVKTFRAICGATIVSSGEPFTFEFRQNTSDLQTGDSVLIHAGRISSTATYHGFVRRITTTDIRVWIPLKNLPATVFEGQSWIIDKFPGDVTAEASHTALYDFLIAPLDGKKKAILGSSGDCAFGDPAPAPLSSYLNPSQQEAVHRAANCGVFHLIWGPPGTGKTKVIPEIVRRVRGPVLLGAFTNTAVDKMLLALLEHNPGAKFLRVGRASDSPELVAKIPGDPSDFFSEDLARKSSSVQALKQALQHATIVAATAHRASTIPYLRSRAFDLAIVDEAGQLTEPLTLGLILRARRFVLIGDDRQLPPVVRTRDLARSMFERLKCETSQVTLLETQYRMHPEIMEVSNRLFYDGRLQAGVSAEERMPPDGQPVVFIPVESERAGRSNPDEAQVVDELVRSFVRDQGISPECIGVVSPFRAQVVLLRQMLADIPVTVDTVERFQGGERDIMILSLARSHGTGFVFDDRRLNVAITRARRKLVLVAHPKLFQKSRYAWICTFTETLKTVGTT